jgi:hypothetical protein
VRRAARGQEARERSRHDQRQPAMASDGASFALRPYSRSDTTLAARGARPNGVPVRGPLASPARGQARRSPVRLRRSAGGHARPHVRSALNAELPIPFDGWSTMEVDLLSRQLRVAVELDGPQHLAGAVAYRRDRRKDRLLQEIPGSPLPRGGRCQGPRRCPRRTPPRRLPPPTPGLNSARASAALVGPCAVNCGYSRSIAGQSIKFLSSLRATPVGMHREHHS